MATQPKLAMIPSGYKDGKLYSVLPSDGVGDFDVTRGSNATRINKDGLIETVTGNTPRLNYPLIDGVVNGCPSLLLEPSRTNLVRYSEAFDNAYWNKSGSSVTSGFISPTGALGAFKLVEDTSAGFHRVYSINAVASGTYSFYAKKGERRYIQIGAGNTGSLGITALFDLELGVVSNITVGDAKIEFIANDWYRCSVSGSGNGGVTSLNLYLCDNDVINSSYSYAGDGTSGVYIFGAQLEQGSYASSYIPNFGTALGVTRLADTANNAGNASTFNDSEGVLFAEISALADDLTNRIISLSNGTNDNIISVQFSNAQSNDIIAYYNATGQTGRVISTSSYNIKSFNKTALVWNNSSFKFYVNGYLIGSSTIETPLVDGTLNKLKFQYGNGTLPFYGNTKKLEYYNTALTALELETLTSYTSFNAMALAQNYKIQ